ncbi:unnamed protein product, partial [Mesorhabditis spiculigera]
MDYDGNLESMEMIAAAALDDNNNEYPMMTMWHDIEVERKAINWFMSRCLRGFRAQILSREELFWKVEEAFILEDYIFQRSVSLEDYREKFSMACSQLGGGKEPMPPFDQLP